MYDDGLTLREANPTAWDISSSGRIGKYGSAGRYSQRRSERTAGELGKPAKSFRYGIKEIKKTMTFTYVMEAKCVFFVAVAVCGSFGTWGGYRALA